MVSKLNRSRSLKRSRRTIRSKRAIRSRRATRSKRVRRSRKVRRSRNNRKSRIKRGGAGDELRETHDDQYLLNIFKHYIKLVETYITWTNNILKVYKKAFDDGNKGVASVIEALTDAKTKLEHIADQFEGLKNQRDIKKIKGAVEGLVKMDQATFLKALVIPEVLIEYINDLHESTDLKYESGQGKYFKATEDRKKKEQEAEDARRRGAAKAKELAEAKAELARLKARKEESQEEIITCNVEKKCPDGQVCMLNICRS
jgi:hypothetical protein